MQEIGQNVVAELDGNTLILKIDLSVEGVPSRTGRSMVVGSTRGNVRVLINGQEYRIGVNVFRPHSSAKVVASL